LSKDKYMPKSARSDGSRKKMSRKTGRTPVVIEGHEEGVVPFLKADSLDNDKIFIECPGATVYDPDTRHVVAGAEFLDDRNPDRGYRIICQPVYAPEHKRRRLIKKKHRGLIRRCQACQDLTVRLIRREGPDFFIPSPKHPGKKQLKPVERSW
jgi:hypothetical protein